MNVPSTHIAGVIGNKCLIFSRINYANNFCFYVFPRTNFAMLIWTVTISVSGNQIISAVSKEISDGSKHSSFSARLLTARVGSGGGENNGSKMYANTRSLTKYSNIINKGNNGVLVEGSEVGDLVGD